MRITISRGLSFLLLFLLFVTTLSPTAVAQTMTPRWISEMPSPEKVLREIKGTDEQNAIERQMGAFKHLLEIIDSMAYGLEQRSLQFPNKVTPDESRIKDIYGKAFADLWYKAKNRDGWIKYVHDGDLWSEMMSKMFSKGFNDLYGQAENNTSARMDKHQKETAGVVLSIGGRSDPPDRKDDFMSLCAAKGLDPITCFVQTGMKQMIKASNSEPVVPGLRMMGNYQNGTFRVSLNPFGDNAVVNCGDVVLLSHYVVERRNGQVLVQIENGEDPFTLSLKSDGTALSGPGSVPIHGHSPKGSGGTTTATAGAVPRTVQTTRTRELTPLEARQYPGAVKNGQTYTINETTTSTEYDPLPAAQPAPFLPKTAPCNIGTLPLFVPATAEPEKSGDFWSNLLPDTGERIPNGLRMLGTYNGQGSAHIQFLPEKAIVGCGVTLLEKPYTVGYKGGMISIGMDGAGGPKALTLGADGLLRGDNAMLTIYGRRKTGEDKLGDESYAPSTDTCAYGALSPQGLKQAAPQPTRAPAPTQPVSNATAPAQNTGTAKGALSITGSFVGLAVNPLANAGIVFLKESLENILRKDGLERPANESAVASWAQACKVASPDCAKGRRAILNARVNIAKLDASGRVGFANVPVGTYWIVTELAYDNRNYVWNLRLDVVPGSNAVRLDQNNALVDFERR